MVGRREEEGGRREEKGRKGEREKGREEWLCLFVSLLVLDECIDCTDLEVEWNEMK